MSTSWSHPLPYDLTRSDRRVSIPPGFADQVPETPGAYVVYHPNRNNACDAILNIGETGLRPNSSPQGLRGRLATTVAHSASENIANDLRSGTLDSEINIVWCQCASKATAKELQDALITLFRDEYGRQPKYNRKREHSIKAPAFQTIYSELKSHIGCP